MLTESIYNEELNKSEDILNRSVKYWQVSNMNDLGLWILQSLFSWAEKSYLGNFCELFH